MPLKDKIARAAYNKEWKQQNKDKTKISNRKWVVENLEQVRTYIRGWAHENPEKISGFNLTSRQNRPWVSLIRNARGRAKKKNLNFSLTNEWGENTYTGKCELTNIEFDTSKTGKGGKAFSPSIDKIDSFKGYDPDNCRFILHSINCFKGQMTDKEMFKIVEALYNVIH